jgi:ABC-2 type transport system permease protein
MNRTLLKADLRAHWPLFLFIQLVLLLYGSISVYMFDPKSAEALINMIAVLPEAMVKAMGFDKLGTDLTEYVASYLYGFIMIVFPLIYIAVIANKLIAAHVERGSIVYLLSSPNSRITIAVTQAAYLLITLAVHIAVTTGVIVLMCITRYPGMLQIGRFLLLNLLTFTVLAAVSGAAFFASCLFSETRWSLTVGAGVPGAMFVLGMVSDLGSDLHWLSRLSIFTLMDIELVLTGGPPLVLALAATAAAAAALFVSAVAVFNRRSLAV